MIVYGYAKEYRFTNTGNLEIKVRIPNIHGPYKKSGYSGSVMRNYTEDKDLPWYNSILLPHNPQEGEVVMLMSSNDSSTDFVVLGLTGGKFSDAQIV